MTKILANIPLPVSGKYSIKSFADYIADINNFADRSNPIQKHYPLSEILSFIPPEEHPDMLVITTPEYLPVPEDVASFPGPKVLIITDWNMCLRFLPHLCGLFDFCFTDVKGVDVLRQFGVTNMFHMPVFGHNPAVFNTEGIGNWSERVWDISFCGHFNNNIHQVRNRLLTRIAGLSDQFKVRIGNFYNQEYVDILKSSKLVFNYAVRQESNMRTFEAMAAGAVPLIESTNMEVPLLFKEDVHYLSYSEQNLERNIADVLRDDDKLREMSAAAAEAVRQHAKKHQITSLLDKAADSNSKSSLLSTDIRAAKAPDKTVVKSNFLGGAYNHLEIIGALSQRWQAQPELEWEVMPGILINRCYEFENMVADKAPFLNILKTRYLVNPAIPGYIRDYISAVLNSYLGEYNQVINSAAECADAVLEISPDELRVFYNFFIPPISLGKSFNVDLQHVYELDGPDGTEHLAKLIADNCLFLKANSYLALKDFASGHDTASQISDNGFVSAPKNFLLVQTAPRLSIREDTRDAAKALFAADPLNMHWWAYVLKACHAIGDKLLYEQFCGKMDFLIAKVFHQDKNSQQHYSNFKSRLTF